MTLRFLHCIVTLFLLSTLRALEGCHHVPSEGVGSSAPLLERGVSTDMTYDSTHRRLTSPPSHTTFVILTSSEKVLPAAVTEKDRTKKDRLHENPNLNRILTPVPGDQASQLHSPNLWKSERLGRPGACLFQLSDWGGQGTHHVMLEDSLDHGGEHFDDHHGPGPLSAVLGRQENMVCAEPVGPCSF